MNAQQKILIIGPAWVGDMVMAQTLFTLIKEKDSSAIIHVLAPNWSRPLLERMPEVSKSLVLSMDHGELNVKGRYQLAKSLREEHYTQAILLPNSFKSALIPWWAHIPQRTGWRGEMRYGLLNDMRKLDKDKLPLMIERFMALGLKPNEPLPADYPRPRLQVSQENITTALETHHIPAPAQPILVLCPGAEFGPAKRWPEYHYAAVAKEKLQAGWQVWIFGSPKDQPVAADIQALTDNQCVDLTGKTSLAQAIDLMSLATQVVTNDSGLMHIAAALNLPLVAVYGSSSPKFTPPLSDKVKIVSLGLPCSPCFKRECPLGHLDCLKKLPPSQILTALDELTT